MTSVMKRITAFIVIVCFLLILVGCVETVSTPTQKPESAGAEAPVDTSLAETTVPESKSNPNITIESVEPVLLDTLKRNCQITQGSGNFNETGLAVGETAVNFTLKDTNGTEFRLSRFLAEKPVMMVFGSFT